MATKNDFLNQLDTKLDEWKADLERLQAKAAEKSGETQEAMRERIEELKVKWEEGASKREQIRATLDERWEDLKDDAERSWGEIQAGAKNVLERVKSYMN